MTLFDPVNDMMKLNGPFGDLAVSRKKAEEAVFNRDHATFAEAVREMVDSYNSFCTALHEVDDKSSFGVPAMCDAVRRRRPELVKLAAEVGIDRKIEEFPI